MGKTNKAPDSLKDLLTRPPRYGEEQPAEPSTGELFIRSADKPSLQLDLVEGYPDLWKLGFEGTHGHCPARRLQLDRQPAARRPDHTSTFQPKGTAASYLPKLARSPQATLYRASGKAVRPLSTHLFGADDRAILRDYSYPWWCIGSVGDGTGTLVGPRLIITAAHCIDFSSKYSTYFTPGKNNLGTSATLPSARVDAWLTGTDDHGVCANDFAIGVLSQPLGLSHGWLGTRSFSSSWVDIPHFTHVGLRGGVLPSWQSGLSVEDIDDGPFDTVELETFCDSESGQSGGPLFAWWSGKPYIVGVLSGYEEEFTYSFPLSFTASHTVFAGGLGMVDYVARMRAEYD